MLTAPVRGDDLLMEIAVEPGFDFLSDEYRRIYDQHGATAFQAPLWLHMLHKRLAPFLDVLQSTITVRDAAHGNLLAVFPLVRQRSSGVTLLQFADFGVCDYNAAVAAPGVLEDIATDPVARRALRQAFGKVDVVMFRKVRSDHFDLGRLLKSPRASTGENPAYECEVGEDFEYWRSKVLRNKFTKGLGRLQRQTERDYGSYEHRLAATETEIREAFDFLRLAQGERQQGGVLEKPHYFDFYRDFALAGAAGGEALTYVSYVAGTPVAVLFGPGGKGFFHSVLIGVDTTTFARISPGTQLLYRVIQLRMAQGHQHFDMGLGDPGYKTHFRPVETPMRNISMAMSPAGMAVSFIYHRSKPLKNMLRELAPNVR